MSEFEGTDVSVPRGERLVLANLRFCLERGEVLVLRGANGAGKSTLLRVMEGLVRPQSGTVMWRGRGIFAEADAHRARLRYLGHTDGLKAALTARENLEFAASLDESASLDKTSSFNESGSLDKISLGVVEDALARWGLARIAETPTRWLSAGQRRRTALARLSLAPRALWLLDEPASVLDAEGVERLSEAVGVHAASGGIAVVAAHGAVALRGAREMTIVTPEGGTAGASP